MSDTQHVPHIHQEPDAWHRHTSDEGTPQEENAATVNPTALALVFLSMVFGVIFVLLILTAYFNNYTFTFKALQQEGVPIARATLDIQRAESQAQLASYGWIDRDAGTVHTPIDQAFNEVIDFYAQGAE